jgi:YD repeat-containing protein
MSIAKVPDVNGNLTISSSCVKCAGGQNDPSQNVDYGGGPDLSGKVDVVSHYNANRPDNQASGFGRTLSVNLKLQTSGPAVTLTRGNGNEAKYLDDGTGGFVSQTVGVRNTLTRDDANGLWKESTPDGRVMAYPIVLDGEISRIAWAQDSVANRHSFAYGPNGLLQSVQDAWGRSTTFAYNAGNLLQSITDFAGRLTLFSYDTTSVAGRSLLTPKHWSGRVPDQL